MKSLLAWKSFLPGYALLLVVLPAVLCPLSSWAEEKSPPQPTAEQMRTIIAALKLRDVMAQDSAIGELSQLSADKNHLAEISRLLRNLYSKTDEVHKEYILNAMGRWYTKETLPLFLEALKNPRLSRFAVIAIGRCGTTDKGAMEALVQHYLTARDATSEDKKTLKAMNERGCPVGARLLKMLDDPKTPESLKGSIMFNLPGLVAKQDIPALQQLAKSPDPAMWMMAKSALTGLLGKTATVNIGKEPLRVVPKEDMETYLQWLRSGNNKLWLRAAAQLQHTTGQGNPNRQEVAKKLLETAHLKGRDADIARSAVMFSLVGWAVPEQSAAIVPFIRGGNQDVREGALQVLSALRTPEAIKAVVDYACPAGMGVGSDDHVYMIGKAAEPYLLEKLKDPQTRSVALNYLREVGTEATLKVLADYRRKGEFQEEDVEKRIRTRLSNESAVKPGT